MKQWLKQLKVLNRKRPTDHLAEVDDALRQQGSAAKAAHGLPHTLVQADGGTSVDTRQACNSKPESDATEPDSEQEVKRLRMAGAI